MAEPTSGPFSIKQISSTVVAIVAVMGAFWSIDNHYASAADVITMQRTIETQVASTQRSLETQVRSLKIERTEDELFKLDMKKQSQRGKLSPEDEAMYQRYLRKLTDANKEQRASDSASKK